MYRSFFRPLLDFFFSLALLIILLPLIIILCICVRLNSKGPSLFKQKRVGKGGQIYHIYKLRTMRQGADREGPYFTIENDPRITKIGSFLRKTSLDEIPQLINILFGDMSFIGPRPNVLAQKNLYTQEEWCTRNSIRPGITGLAQCTTRSTGTHRERTYLDLKYVEEISLFLDLKILINTIKTVLLRKNVN